MADRNGARIMTGLAATPPVLADPGEGGGRVHVWSETISAVSGDATGSTYLMARLPSNARILGESRLYWDAVGTSTATGKVGVFNPAGRSVISNDDDAFITSFTLSTASSAALIPDHANYGKRLYEFVAGQASDPKADLDVKITTATADLNGGGDISVEIFYAVD